MVPGTETQVHVHTNPMASPSSNQRTNPPRKRLICPRRIVQAGEAASRYSAQSQAGPIITVRCSRVLCQGAALRLRLVRRGDEIRQGHVSLGLRMLRRETMREKRLGQHVAWGWLVVRISARGAGLGRGQVVVVTLGLRTAQVRGECARFRFITPDLVSSSRLRSETLVRFQWVRHRVELRV